MFKRIDPRYFMDEKTEKPITEAMSSVQEMKIGFADGYFYDTPGYGYDEDLARRSESYREGYREGQEQRERDEVLDKEDAEDERLSDLDDAYAEADYYDEQEQEDRYRDLSEGHGGEGAMVVRQLNRMSQIVDELRRMVSEDDNHKEWVEAKITKAMDYVSTVLNYLSGTDDNIDPNV